MAVRLRPMTGFADAAAQTREKKGCRSSPNTLVTGVNLSYSPTEVVLDQLVRHRVN